MRLALVAALGVSACASPAQPQNPTAAPAYPRFAAAVAARDSAVRLGADGRHAEAAALYRASAVLVPDLVASGRSFYDAATAYALAGDSAQAGAMLESAIAHGFRDGRLLASDPALAALAGTARWATVVAAAAENETRYRAAHADPARARVHTSDIERFWRAADLAAREDSVGGKAAVFEREYIAKGTRGLLDFHRAKIRSPARLAETVARYPAFYASVRAPTLELAGLEGTIRGVFERMERLYPEAIYPDVYFVVGRVSSAGTATEYGLLLGAEQNVGSATTTLDELPEAQRRIVFPRDDLPHVIAHELVHFQQYLGGMRTLLDAALVEGGATFLADLMARSAAVPHFRTWGAAHEREVWARFVREMDGEDIGAWLGNNAGATAEWPADLGYFVGYEISKAYYERAADKDQAVAALIRLEDPRAILRESGYGSRFAP